jgi:hypothetical protein
MAATLATETAALLLNPAFAGRLLVISTEIGWVSIPKSLITLMAA